MAANATGWSPAHGADVSGTEATISSGPLSPPDPKKSRTAMAVIPGTQPEVPHPAHRRQSASSVASSGSVARSEARVRAAEADLAVHRSELELQRQRFNLQVLRNVGSPSRSCVGSDSDASSIAGTHVTSISRSGLRGSLPLVSIPLQGVEVGGATSSTSRPALSAPQLVPTSVHDGSAETSAYPGRAETSALPTYGKVPAGEKSPRGLARARHGADEKSLRRVASASPGGEKSSRGAVLPPRHEDRSMPYPSTSPMPLGRFVVAHEKTSAEQRAPRASPRTQWYDMSHEKEKEFIGEIGRELDSSLPQPLQQSDVAMNVGSNNPFKRSGGETSSHSAHAAAETSAQTLGIVKQQGVSIGASSSGAPRMPAEKSAASAPHPIVPKQLMPFPFHVAPSMPPPATSKGADGACRDIDYTASPWDSSGETSPCLPGPSV